MVPDGVVLPTVTDSEVTTRITNKMWTSVRLKRNRKLSNSDVMALQDRVMTDEQKTYRQALRDLPASSSPSLDEYYNLDLTSVTWPTEPS
mgnify:CR=1 FL=1